jgi:hypothetical protein
MRRRTLPLKGLRLLGAWGVGVAFLCASWPTHALVDATAVDGLAKSDVLRSGGSSAAFKEELVAVLSEFSQVTRVFRMCGTSTKLTGDNCDGNGGANSKTLP